MAIMLQLKYDELRIIAKQFRDCGEDVTLLHTKTRDRVQDLHGMWKGDAADKFFEEMELELLPPLKQTAKTLFAMQDVLLRVMKLIYETDQDTAEYFRRNFDYVGSFSSGGSTGNVGGGFTGTGVFPGIGRNQQGTESGNAGATGVGGTGGTDTGSTTNNQGATGSQSSDQQDGTSGQGSHPGSGAGGDGTGFSSRGGTGSSGSGGGGTTRGTTAGSGGTAGQTMNPPIAPDHIYQSASDGGTSQAGGPSIQGGTAGDSQNQGTGAAAGAAAASVAAGVGVASIGKAGRGFRKRRR